MSTRLINVSKSDLGCISIISKRTYHKDVKSEKILKYVYQLNKYNVLKLNFSPF